MAMDFFEHQEQARRQTTWLVVLFILAVLAIIAAVYGSVVAGLMLANSNTISWNDPRLILGVTTVVGLVVLMGTLYKLASLSAGGAAVAESLGGRLIQRNTHDPDEQKALNIVDEMAIAAGMAVPPIYVVQGSGINAFAAGFSTDDAVVGITQGAIRRLSRDELQGVIAHEFSHILNGDMRLNLRLVGVLHGILIIGLIGVSLIRSLRYMSHSRSSSNRKGGGGQIILLILALGVILSVIGYVGVFFGNVIKSAVSRQREYLADAAAVQFTRNPDGIAGALKKLGSTGGSIDHPRASELSHLYFAPGVFILFGNLLDSHPPLPKRILRINPSWDGVFPAAEKVELIPSTKDDFAAEQNRRREHQQQRSQQMIAILTGAGAAELATVGILGDSAIRNVSQVRQDKVAYASLLRNAIPPNITEAASDPYGSRAILYSFLLAKEARLREHQLDLITRLADETVAGLTHHLADTIPTLPTELRLPIVEISLPSLRQLSKPQFDRVLRVIDQLITADNQTTLREWALKRMVRRQYDIVHAHHQDPWGNARLTDHPSEVTRLLSLIAHAGSSNPAQAAQAFSHGAPLLDLTVNQPLPANLCRLDQFDTTIEPLSQLRPLEKRRLLEAAAKIIAADRVATAEEAELLRVIADTLAVPMPPILPGQKLT
ncbi:MAG: M48 family metallopeptidase [Phycisphaeraceae bacterium]